MAYTKKKRKINTSNGGDPNIIDEQIFFHNINNISNKVHCDFCDKEITKHARVIDPLASDLDICMNCFINGKENERHSKTNSYHVINKLNFPLFDISWTAEEELLLLEGLEKCGFGNWNDIAELIGTEKTKEDVEKHYEKYFLTQKKFLPNNNSILTKRDEKNQLLTPQKKDKMDIEMEPKTKKRANSKAQINDKRDPTNLIPISQLSTAPNKTVNKDANTSASEIVGYMPLRGDFDFEFDNEAELLLAEMEFNDDDKPEEIQLKQRILEIYNSRLDERIKRKEFVISRDMLDFKKQNTLDRMRSKEEKEINGVLKIFARFNTKEEQDELVQGIYKEKLLKQRIEELRYYKKMGLKTFEEVEAFLSEKRKKDEAYQKKAKQNDYFVYDSKMNSNRANTPRRTRLAGRNGLEAESIEKKNKAALTQINEKELNLCENLGINTYEYLLIKDILMRECVKSGNVQRSFLDNMIKIDKERAKAAFDFLVSHKIIIENKKDIIQT